MCIDLTWNALEWHIGGERDVAHCVFVLCVCEHYYCTVDFHVSCGLMYAHKDVWGKPILTGKQVGLCVSTCNYWLLLATLMVDIETLGS